MAQAVADCRFLLLRNWLVVRAEICQSSLQVIFIIQFHFIYGLFEVHHLKVSPLCKRHSCLCAFTQTWVFLCFGFSKLIYQRFQNDLVCSLGDFRDRSVLFWIWDGMQVHTFRLQCWSESFSSSIISSFFFFFVSNQVQVHSQTHVVLSQKTHHIWIALQMTIIIWQCIDLVLSLVLSGGSI